MQDVGYGDKIRAEFGMLAPMKGAKNEVMRPDRLPSSEMFACAPLFVIRATSGHHGEYTELDSMDVPVSEAFCCRHPHVFHRTQDVDAGRVAAQFNVVSAAGVVPHASMVDSPAWQSSSMLEAKFTSYGV